MKFAFRVDANSQIGTGHFMRCLTLAKAVQQHGAQIRFVSRNLPDCLQAMLAANGMQLISINRNVCPSSIDELKHAHWLGTSQKEDALATINALSDELWNWLIVDHYALDARWESMLRQSAKHIMVIDDIADRAHNCDVLLDQNFYVDMESRYTGKTLPSCQLLLGPKYALLRDEFKSLRKHVEPRRGPVKRILVFFGGADADNHTGRAIDALAEVELSDVQIDVVIGALHPCCEQIKAACRHYRFLCHVQTNLMAELMAAADLAIGAGGSATWERCCLGLPCLAICTAPNQKNQIADAAREGFLYAPSLGTNWPNLISNHILALFENENLREGLSNRAMEAVDGGGMLRILGFLGCPEIKMRMVNANDSLNLFNWRNHKTIRSVSRNTEPITPEDHQRWFADSIGSPDRFLLIGQSGETPVGVVRFDIKKNVAEVSIYLVPGDIPTGQGRNLLLSGERWLKEYQPDIKHIRACVIGGNKHSHRLFLGANYQIKNTHYLKQL